VDARAEAETRPDAPVLSGGALTAFAAPSLPRAQINHRAFRAPRVAPQLAALTDAQLAAARRLLDDEATELRISAEQALAAAAAGGGGGPGELSAEAFGAAWEAARAELVYLPASRRLVPRAAALAPGAPEAQEHAAALRARLAALAALFAREEARLARLEARVALHTRGLEAKAAALGAAAAALADERSDRELELGAFERLAADEAAALAARLARAEARAAEAARGERELQARYADLVGEMDALEERLERRRAR